MANKFNVNLLMLSGQAVTATSNSLFVNGNQIVGVDARIFIGSGSPEGSIQAVSGSLYTDWYNQTFYMKISGNSSNAYGWV